MAKYCPNVLDSHYCIPYTKTILSQKGMLMGGLASCPNFSSEGQREQQQHQQHDLPPWTWHWSRTSWGQTSGLYPIGPKRGGGYTGILCDVTDHPEPLLWVLGHGLGRIVPSVLHHRAFRQTFRYCETRGLASLATVLSYCPPGLQSSQASLPFHSRVQWR